MTPGPLPGLSTRSVQREAAYHIVAQRHGLVPRDQVVEQRAHSASAIPVWRAISGRVRGPAS